MSNGEMIVTAENRPSAGAIEAMDQYSRTGTVSLGYLKAVLGDWQQSVGSSSVSAPLNISTRRTWRGRRVYTDEEMANMECLYPPDRDL